MRTLTSNEFKVFDSLCRMSEDSVRKAMTAYLNKHYKRVISTKHYICAVGDIPIALVAHMDTVFDIPSEIFYDRDRNVMWSPTGMGADDRTGIFIIMQIIKEGLKPHIIFTTGEEKGCVGSGILAGQKCPFKKLNYIIQLDRRGTNDCVFYDCDNPEFTKYVESFGFSEAIGSFTDITELCPKWKVAGVNLSVGYKDEHTKQERLYITPMWATFDKVKKMLTEEEIPFFEYKESISAWRGYYSSALMEGDNAWYSKLLGYDTYPYDEQCDICQKPCDLTDQMIVQTKDGFYKYVCTDCFIKMNVAYCDSCKEPYELPQGKIVKQGEICLCPTCQKRVDRAKNGQGDKK